MVSEDDNEAKGAAGKDDTAPPKCFESYLVSSQCKTHMGLNVCDSIRRIFKHCPGEKPLIIADGRMSSTNPVREDRRKRFVDTEPNPFDKTPSPDTPQSLQVDWMLSKHRERMLSFRKRLAKKYGSEYLRLMCGALSDGPGGNFFLKDEACEAVRERMKMESISGPPPLPPPHKHSSEVAAKAEEESAPDA